MSSWDWVQKDPPKPVKFDWNLESEWTAEKPVVMDWPELQDPSDPFGSKKFAETMKELQECIDVLQAQAVEWDAKFAALASLTAQGVVVGLADVSGVLPRQDIDLMIKNEPDMFNLFMIAFKFLQMEPESNINSYFSIAGIHGYPKRSWNNVEGKVMGVGGDTQTERFQNESGYCAHAQTTFPPWHRLYLVMLEQVLYVSMFQLAKTYDEPHRARYLAAAKRFRLPYWDYYRPRRVGVTFPGIIDKGLNTSAPYDFCLPEIFTSERVKVRMLPDNKLVELNHNPFQHFQFTEKNGTLTKQEWDFLSLRIDAEAQPLLNRERTHRHPVRVSTGTKWDNPDRMRIIMNELRMDACRYMLNMIGQDYYSNYDSFSNMSSLNHDPLRQPKKPSTDAGVETDSKDSRDKHYNAAKTVWENSGSLEDFHNLYHLLLGGLDPGAHVSRVPIAAFDPAFWFHHNQLERIFTIWQTVNSGRAPDKPLDSEPVDKVAYAASWFSNGDEAKKPLLPFKKANGEFWTANDARDTAALGYTYPDLVDKSSTFQVRFDFDRLYRWSVPRRGTESWLPCPDEQKPLDLNQSEFFVNPPCPPTEPASRQVSAVDPSNIKGDIWEWFINMKVERLALNGAFSVLYYINDEKHQAFDSKKDIVGPTLAGITYIFAAPIETCPNCKRQMEEGAVTDSTLSITSQLMDYIADGQLKSLHPDDVKPFLEGHLRWRIVDANGERVDPRVMSKKKQFRLQVSAVLNHDRPCNNEQAPEIYEFNSIVKNIIKSAKKGSLADKEKESAAVSSNNPVVRDW